MYLTQRDKRVSRLEEDTLVWLRDGENTCRPECKKWGWGAKWDSEWWSEALVQKASGQGSWDKRKALLLWASGTALWRLLCERLRTQKWIHQMTAENSVLRVWVFKENQRERERKSERHRQTDRGRQKDKDSDIFQIIRDSLGLRDGTHPQLRWVV